MQGWTQGLARAALSVIACCAGHTYTSLHAEGGNQGMLRVCLLDKESSQVICIVNTHLKAKTGLKNDAIRDHQVGTIIFCCLYLPWRKTCSCFPDS